MKFPWFRKLQKKENPVGCALYVNNGYTYKNRKNKDYAIDGYHVNIIVYRAIREISTGIASVKLDLRIDGEIIEDPSETEVGRLIEMPNPNQGASLFLKNIFNDYLLTGEMFIVQSPATFNINGEREQPKELWALNPIYMHVKGDKCSGIPEKYIYEQEEKRVFQVDPLTGESDVFYLKMYNPLSYWRGQSPLQAAGLSVDTHNRGLNWNLSLLRNGGRPSGLMKFEGNPGDDVLNRVREWLKRQNQGDSNAGELPILTDGADYIELGNSPRDMDYISSLKETAKYIASAYGVPLPLIDNDASTFNNLEQAKERLWTDTIIPLYQEFLNQFSKWLSQGFGQEIKLTQDLDSIQALEPLRDRRFDKLVKGINNGLLTINEAREQIRKDPVGVEGDELFISSSLIPLSFGTFADLPSEDQTAALSLRSVGYTEKEIRNMLEEK